MKIKLFMIFFFLLLCSSPEVLPEEPKTGRGESKISEEDMKIINVMDMLEIMDVAENLDLLENMEILAKEENNENEN